MLERTQIIKMLPTNSLYMDWSSKSKNVGVYENLKASVELVLKWFDKESSKTNASYLP